MIKVFKIFFRDLRTISRNIAALIIVIGLCILPSLYAWINIKACWNPYSNTGNLPVAIVNADEGAVFNGKAVNVGNSVIEQLKKNKSIGWVFVDEWQGNYGLNEGKYYALIEIPRNFSSGLISLTTTTPQKPAIIYRVNGKLNAIAAKITNVAKDKLVNSIKSNFISTVNKEALVEIKTNADNAHINESQISDLKSTFTETNNSITSLKKYISEANSDSESFQKYLNNVTATLPKITEQIDSLEKIEQETKTLTLTTKQTIELVSTNLNNDIVEVQSLNDENKTLLTKLNNINNNSIGTDTVNTMKESINICDSLHNILSGDIANLQTLNKNLNNSSLTLLIDSLNDLDKQIVIEKNKLTDLIPLIISGSSKASVNSAIDTISQLSDELSKKITNTSTYFYTKGSPVLSDIVGNLSINLDDTNSILDSTKTIVPQLNALAAFGTASSKLSIEQANKLDGRLSSLQTDLDKLIDKMNVLTSDNINKILDVLENNPSQVADFISSPVQVKEVEVYDSGLFGVGLTPFYTVLAIWVGALLACALLSVECEDFECDEKLNLKEKHFGKMLLFLFLSQIQAAIITLGDIYILGVKPENMKLMLIFSSLTAVTFTVIIFTLVSLFGNVGKAIAVVMMVFQIAGSGGIYPIQTNPKIFGTLQPLWPFTYAINGFREAIAGPVWNSVYQDIEALVGFILVFLVLAILKKPFHRLNGFLEHKFKEAEL